MIDAVGNSQYYEVLKRWWQHTDTKLDYYDKKLEAHQDYVFKMREYHNKKDVEQSQIYEYYQGRLKIAKEMKGATVDVLA